jgi:hypothetical protein
MKPTTEPTTRNAINIPAPMAAILNQRIRRVLSRQGSILSRRYLMASTRRACACGQSRPEHCLLNLRNAINGASAPTAHRQITVGPQRRIGRVAWLPNSS